MTDDPYDEQVGARASSLLHATTTAVVPDVDRLVRGGVVRGRALRRRRRRVGGSVAAVAVLGVLGAVGSLGPELVSGTLDDDTPAQLATDGPAPEPTADPTADPTGQPASANRTQPVDALPVVSALDAPRVIGELVPGGQVGPILRQAPYGVRDENQAKTVHFLYDGALTTFGIERADTLATCAALVDPANQPDGEPSGTCVEEDGTLLLVTDPETLDGVTAQSVWAFVHGFVVSAVSYDAAGGKDAEPVTDGPALSREELTTIVTSDVWFGA